MPIHTFTFSPTGTSAKILRGITAGITQSTDSEINHCDLTLKPVSNRTFSADDIVIISSPVYGGKITPIVKQRLQNISGNGARCIVVAVYGNRAFEDAVNDFASYMSGLGFSICGGAAFVGEHSYSTADAPIAHGRPDRQDMADANAFGREIAAKISDGGLKDIDITALTDEPSPAESMANFRNFVIGYQQARTHTVYLPKIDTSLCDDCGSCYDVCPTEAITSGSQDADPTKCIKCCACVKICPQNARTFHTPFRQPLAENFSLRKSPRWIL